VDCALLPDVLGAANKAVEMIEKNMVVQMIDNFIVSPSLKYA